jgi:hypothetical protein
MRNAACVLLATIGLSSGPALASASFGAEAPPVATLNWVQVTVNPNGSVKYEMAGSAAVGGQSFTYSGVGAYDPASKQFSERLTEQGGNEIQSKGSCLTDPWQVSIVCSAVSISSKGYGSAAMAYITNLRAPISANTLSGPDRERLAAELQKALAAKKKADDAAALQRAKLHAAGTGVIASLPTPTPPPFSRVREASIHTADLHAAPPKPVYPAYGAVYTGGNPPATMKVGTAATVMVTVQNTSSQTWPAGGNFRLSFHWFRGGAQVVHDGDRTLLPSAVPPGVAVSLMAKVTAPWTIGAATLQWDMVQEGVTWFSNKGVPMSAPKSVNVTP